MIIEQHPSLHSLSVEDKLLLSEELYLDALLHAQQNPALLTRVEQRLQEYRIGPDNAISWQVLKEKILSRQKIL